MAASPALLLAHLVVLRTSGLLRGDFWGHLGFIAGASVAVKLAPMALLLLLGLRFRQTVASGVLLAAPPGTKKWRRMTYAPTPSSRRSGRRRIRSDRQLGCPG